MVLRRVHNWLVILIILCSLSLYKLTILGRLQEIAELFGVGLIIFIIILHLVYSEKKTIQGNFYLPIALIILSIFTSMFMAYYSRDQSIGQTILAQRALYYYLFYFALHQLKVSPRDIEKIFLALGIIYIALYLVQYFLYPTVLFDAYVRSDRGTVRIYLPGSDYMFITFFYSIQYFFRTNKFKYLIYSLLIFSIFILTGGRQTMATVVLVVVMFLFFDRKIKSRILLFSLGIIGVAAIFIIARDIFEAILVESRKDLNYGKEYIRLRAAEFYLTDFFKNTWAYITGNGMYFTRSQYGKEVFYYSSVRHFTLGDIGIIGNYAIYGAFFVIAVLIICFKSLLIRFEADYFFIKLMFITMTLSLFIAGGFASSDTICFVVLMLYMIDVSRSELIRNENS